MFVTLQVKDNALQTVVRLTAQLHWLLFATSDVPKRSNISNNVNCAHNSVATQVTSTSCGWGFLMPACF